MRCFIYSESVCAPLSLSHQNPQSSHHPIYAIDKHGRLIDFMLSDRRNTKAACRFLAKALKVMRNWPPVSITTSRKNRKPTLVPSVSVAQNLSLPAGVMNKTG